MKKQAITITGACCGGAPTTSGKAESFTSYQIQSENGLVKRRFSEFELLHGHLCRSYPLSVIPPIPEKHSISSAIKTYVGMKKSEAENQQVIQHRIRSLQIFLDFVHSHPVLSADKVFHEFLAENPAWNVNVLDSNLAASVKSEIDDPEFGVVISQVNAFQEALERIEKTQSKILKAHKENCKTHGELGQALNAFSIEYEPLQDPLDTLGQKFDNSGYELQALVDSQEVLVETVEIGVGLCKAAKKTISNYGKDTKNDTLDQEVKRVLETVEGLLSRALTESVAANTKYFRTVQYSY